MMVETRMTTADDDLIRAHADMVFATCMRFTGNAQDAADVSQEVFIAWMQQRGRIRGPVAAWLHGTARRRSLDWLRRHHRRSQHERQSDVPALAMPSGDDGAWRTALDACLAKLDPRQRTLVIEHHLMGLSQESLATRWRISQATVSRHLALAMERLRQGLVRHGVTAATVAAVSVALSDLKASEACPSGLRNPLLAHAQIQGGGALVGAGSLVVWWTTWPVIAAACLTSLLAVGVGGLVAWRAVIASSLPADPVASVIARLPPVPHVAQAPPPGVPRYRSIEALIDRLPAVDEARQVRIRGWLTQNGASNPWDRLQIPTEAFAKSLEYSESDLARPVPTLLRETDRHAIESAGPLLVELSDPTATLTEAGWLATDYHRGRFRWHGDVLSTVNQGVAKSRYLFLALSRRALQARDAHAALADVDAFAASMRRSPINLIDAMIATALDQTRDNVYLRLVIQGKLGRDDLHRWCQELPVANRLLEEGYLGESLLISLPSLEDYLRWGEEALTSQVPPEHHIVPNLDDWLNRPKWIQMTLENDGILGRIREATAGRDHMSAIIQDSEHAGVLTHLMIPNLAESGQYAAQVRLAHSGKRLMAWLIDNARQGLPLPSTLSEVASAVADGKALMGGSDLTYGLRYKRLSENRFRLEIDPDGGSPAYAIPSRLVGLVQGAKQQVRSDVPLPPIVILPSAWEADVMRLTEPAATHVVFPNEQPEPMLPNATN
jgi:RNA polymerase sigma factor (sigma-70 family)